MKKGARPTYFHEPHIKGQRAECGSWATVWPPLIYIVFLTDESNQSPWSNSQWHRYKLNNQPIRLSQRHVSDHNKTSNTPSHPHFWRRLEATSWKLKRQNNKKSEELLKHIMVRLQIFKSHIYMYIICLVWFVNRTLWWYKSYALGGEILSAACRLKNLRGLTTRAEIIGLTWVTKRLLERFNSNKG